MKIVLVLIGITTFGNAVLTYLYTVERGEASLFAGKASYELELMHDRSRMMSLGYQTINGVAALRERRLRMIAAKELGAQAAQEGLRERYAIASHEYRRLQMDGQSANDTRSRDASDVSLTETLNHYFNGKKGEYDDPSYPVKLVIGSIIWKSAARLAIWDAYDEADTASEIRVAVVFAVVTIFAFVLYLFGQSLAIGRDCLAAYILSVVAALLLLLGFGVAGYGFLLPVPAVENAVTLPEPCRTGDDAPVVTIAEASARCYALAELMTALPRDPRDYMGAQAAYRAATRDELRPGFNLARYRSARATSPTVTLQNMERDSVYSNRSAQLSALPKPDGIAWRLKLKAPVSVRRPLNMVVYKLGASSIAFVIPSASGPIGSSEIARRSATELAGFRSVLRRDAACLGNGEKYAIEIRRGDDVLARTFTTMSGKLPSFRKVVVHEQGIAICIPDGDHGWIRAPAGRDHLEAGYSDTDDLAGVGLFAFFSPRYASPSARRVFRNRALFDALWHLRFGGRDSRTLTSMPDPCLRGRYMARSSRAAFASPHLMIITQTWVSQDGMVHVAVLWRKNVPGSIARETVCSVLASVISES